MAVFLKNAAGFINGWSIVFIAKHKSNPLFFRMYDTYEKIRLQTILICLCNWVIVPNFANNK